MSPKCLAKTAYWEVLNEDASHILTYPKAQCVELPGKGLGRVWRCGLGGGVSRTVCFDVSELMPFTVGSLCSAPVDGAGALRLCSSAVPAGLPTATLSAMMIPLLTLGNHESQIQHFFSKLPLVMMFNHSN